MCGTGRSGRDRERHHGEIGINTLLADSYGVPVVLAGGDAAACEEFSVLVPRGVTRTGRTVAFNAENMAAAYSMLQLLAVLTHLSP
ncbi:M55 family metallopeptidase [Streptosporangium amethystogenes subsp. fukuiense]|uniref:M55 family metallopeptidase n=1 Tax=Streptosporangium amethystogenes subsp. fukuiense TaxID=698418 RepID=A0ABW2SX78_9ACTN